LTERNVSLLCGGELDSCRSDVLPVEAKEVLDVYDTVLVLKILPFKVRRKFFLVL
jgi:hypothetical protein